MTRYFAGCLLALVGCGDNLTATDRPDAHPVAHPDAAPMVAPATAIPLATPDGSFYTAPLTIGTQTFAVDVDTGSTTTAVAAMACTKCTGITPLYAPTATAMDLHQMAQTGYADGSRWSGEIFSDQMGLEHGTPSVAVAFAGITNQKMFFDPTNAYQGILGLGPPELLETGTTSFLAQLTAAHEPAVLGFELCDTDGTMWVGGVDETKAASPVLYTPMLPIDGNSNPFYAIAVTDMGLGGTSLGFDNATFGSPIVDTGTSLTYLPTAVMTALLAKVNATPNYASVFTQPLSQNGTGCATTVSGVTAAQVDAVLPPMTLTFPSGLDAEFTISAPASQSYVYDGGDGTFCLAIFDDGGSGSLIGDATMRAFISVFDVAQHRMGFAPDVGCATTRRADRTPRRLREHGHPPHRVR